MKKVWLMCGIPASGKSTWAREHQEMFGGAIVSRDEIRFSMVAENEPYFSKEDEVFDEFIRQIQELISDEETQDIYIDATHITEASRNKVLDRLYLGNVEIYAVDFNEVFAKCILNNANREGRARVPNSVIENMYKKYEAPSEGEKYKYTNIIHIYDRKEEETKPSGRIFLTSDLHFNHNREFIWKARGFNSVEEMNETIIERFNSVVQKNDTVYILGDCALGGGSSETLAANKKLIERLNGRLYIIRGNHDTNTRISMYNCCENVASAGKWADMINYRGYHFYLSHFPTMTGSLEKESLKQCTCNLFGHTHQQSNFYLDMPFLYHVGVDSHDCYPVLLDDIIREMKNKVNECLEEI